MWFPLDDLLTIETLIAAVTAMVAGICRGFTGFGSSLVMTPVYAVLYGPTLAVAITLTLEIAISVDTVTRVVRVIPWRTMLPIWVAAWAAIPFGTWILLVADADILRRVISLIVAGLAVILLMGWRYRGRRGLFSDLCIGAMSGTLNSSTSLGGPPVLFYMLSGSGPANSVRAAMIANVFVVSVPTVSILLFKGTLDATALWLMVVVFPFYLVPTFVGNRMFHASDERTYRRASAWLMLLIAIGTFLVE